MIIPQLNLNGSHGPTLVEDLLVAIDALRLAKQELGKCAPHGRDYQTTKDPHQYLRLATLEHRLRCAKLDEVLKEVEQLATSIQEQVDVRAQRVQFR